MSDSLQYDVVIVGAGPSGLSSAIRLKQLCQEQGKNLSVCILEKGSEVGAHILSGAVIDPKALNELIPDWKEQGAPLNIQAQKDKFLFLTKRRAFRLPTPPQMKNHGNYVISLGNLCRWLAQKAEGLGVEIYPGFAVAKAIFDDDDCVIGVETTPMGLDAEGKPTDRYQEGVKVFARHVLLAEGCHGSLSKEIMIKYNLRKDAQPQTYGLGIKELWEVKPENHHPGFITHTIGWPLDRKTYGGSFIYHLENNQISIGFVVGLDYQNPYMSPYEEFQRFKQHPAIRSLLEGGKRMAYGARALNEGGYQSIPNLSFPGGSLIGCSAGFLNVPKIKGTHTAMKSGMIAAETVFEFLSMNGKANKVLLGEFDERVKKSWINKELKKVRNIRPGFRWGLLSGLINAALETYLFRGVMPWTLKHHKDNESLKLAKNSKPIAYAKPDNIISFDRLTSVFQSNTNHPENQPCHLHLSDPERAISCNLALYDSPEQRYCPAGVYEIVRDGDNQAPRLQINAQNCVHCKTCDIKDPTQNINWVPPEGGGGPRYPNM